MIFGGVVTVSHTHYFISTNSLTGGRSPPPRIGLAQQVEDLLCSGTKYRYASEDIERFKRVMDAFCSYEQQVCLQLTGTMDWLLHVSAFFSIGM